MELRGLRMMPRPLAGNKTVTNTSWVTMSTRTAPTQHPPYNSHEPTPAVRLSWGLLMVRCST